MPLARVGAKVLPNLFEASWLTSNYSFQRALRSHRGGWSRTELVKSVVAEHGSGGQNTTLAPPPIVVTTTPMIVIRNFNSSNVA